MVWKLREVLSHIYHCQSMDQRCYKHLCTYTLFLLQAKMCDIKACHQPLANERSDLIIIFVKMGPTQILISFLVIYSGADGFDK